MISNIKYKQSSSPIFSQSNHTINGFPKILLCTFTLTFTCLYIGGIMTEMLMIAEVSMMVKVSMMALVTEVSVVSMTKLMTAWTAMMSIIAWWLGYLCYPWSLWWLRCPLVSMMPWWSLWCAGWHWWLWCSDGLDVWEIYDVPIMNLTIVMFMIALMTLKSLVFLKNMTTVMFMRM